MKNFFYRFQKNILQCFTGKNLLWHGLAISCTYLLVLVGFDQWYFLVTRDPTLQAWLFPAAILGGLLPLLLPLTLWIMGGLQKHSLMLNTAYAIGQAGIVGWLISSSYKFFTGRVPPGFRDVMSTGVDQSHIFQFGFFRGGIFWGWPSTHTTVAWAMSVTLFVLFPKTKWKFVALLYALYIGIGVSSNIHWFTDFLAGATIGSVIGVVVGNAYRNRLNGNQSPRSFNEDILTRVIAKE